MKLPVIADGGKQTPSAAQKGLSVKPVQAEGASRPEFPKRDAVRRGVGLMVGGALLAGSALAQAKSPVPAPAKVPVSKGSIDGQPIGKKAPKIMIYRDSGGIGPSQEFDVAEVEAFLNWQFAKQKLDIKTNYKLEHDGLSLELDGFDPQRNVGYEFFYGSDWDDFNEAARAKLADWQKNKKAAILLIDMDGTPDGSALSKQISKFFKAIKKTMPATGVLASEPAPAPVETKKTPPTKSPPPSKNPMPPGLDKK